MGGNIFYWALYDFSNSFISAALEGLYFSQWVIIDNKFADIWYGATFSIATLLLLVSAPFLGAWADARGKKMPFLRVATILVIILGVLLGVVANSTLPVFGKVVSALVVFLFLQYFYQASFIFYNPILNQISSTKTRGVISGIGQLSNNLGFVIATGVFLWLAQSNFSLFGDPGRSQVFIPGVLIFLVFSLPMLFKFREREETKSVKVLGFKKLFVKTFGGIKDLFKKNRNVGIFLVAFMLISDAVLTIQLFSSVFMDQVYKIPDSEKFKLLALMMIITIPSCYLAGRLGDKIGLKKILLSSCTMLIISFLMIGLSSSVKVLYILMGLVGLAWGGYYATARALLINISPPQQLGEYFGFYAIFQKFASIVGPLIWGVVTLVLVDYGIIRYRVAVIILVGLMVGGTILLTRVKEKRFT